MEQGVRALWVENSKILPRRRLQHPAPETAGSEPEMRISRAARGLLQGLAQRGGVISAKRSPGSQPVRNTTLSCRPSPAPSQSLLPVGTGALCCSWSTFPTIARTSLAPSSHVMRTSSEQEACPPSRLIREHARLVQEGTGSASGADTTPTENPVLQAAWGTGEGSAAGKQCRLLGLPGGSGPVPGVGNRILHL